MKRPERANIPIEAKIEAFNQRVDNMKEGDSMIARALKWVAGLFKKKSCPSCTCGRRK